MSKENSTELVAKYYPDGLDLRRSSTMRIWEDIPLDEYIRRKIKLLSRDFLVVFTPEQTRRMEACKSEFQVDQMARSLIKKRLSED